MTSKACRSGGGEHKVGFGHYIRGEDAIIEQITESLLVSLGLTSYTQKAHKDIVRKLNDPYRDLHVTVGFYEYVAYRANLWRYEKANVMLGDSYALYIPFGEFLMFLAILPIGARVLSMNHRRQTAFIEGGAAFALAIALGYALAYFLLEVR
jgi:hypothetical protein